MASLDGTVSYTYDSTGQLIGADNYSFTMTDESYTYDANGNRIDSDGDGAFDHETYFVYDGYQIVLQFDQDQSSSLPLEES